MYCKWKVAAAFYVIQTLYRFVGAWCNNFGKHWRKRKSQIKYEFFIIQQFGGKDSRSITCLAIIGKRYKIIKLTSNSGNQDLSLKKKIIQVHPLLSNSNIYTNTRTYDNKLICQDSRSIYDPIPIMRLLVQNIRCFRK